jgi:Rap1a immunity proteins
MKKYLKGSIQIIIASYLCLATSSVAYGLTGNQLLEFCKDGQKPELLGLCTGYFYGLKEGLVAQKAWQKKSGIYDNLLQNEPYCIPDNITLEQQRYIFLNFLNNHPEHRHIIGSILFIFAMREVFPCKEER